MIVTPPPVKVWAEKNDIPFLQPEKLDKALEEKLKDFDVSIVVAYGKIFPEWLINLPKHGTLNIHYSLLPKYRGAAPIQRAIIDGEAVTGVTIMRIETLLDAGAMLAKMTRPIGPDDTSDVVEQDLSELGATLLLHVIDDIVAGTADAEPQDDRLSTYAARLTKEEGLVDWTLPALYIHNRVRGLYPWPHAYTYLDGERLILLRTGVEESSTTDDPGTIVDVSAGSIHVATGHSGRIVIHELQPEGRRAMKTRDFLAGHPVRIGTRLTGP